MFCKIKLNILKKKIVLMFVFYEKARNFPREKTANFADIKQIKKYLKQSF